jgi:hypothetical protein
MAKNKYLFVLFLPLCCVAAGVVIWGQTTNRVAQSASTPVARGIPDGFLYWHFLNHLKHLEGRARNPQRKPGDETLGEYYKTKLKLNEGEYSTLLGLARECEAETNAHMLRRKETINRLRAQYPGGKIASRDNPPPLPDEVKQLQKEYEDLLAKFSNKVKLALGPTKMNELSAYLKNEFGRQLRVRKVDLPREKDPSKSKLPPMVK